MPINKILPDGNVEIYNTKTGEQKTVRPDELSAYNPNLIEDYNKMKSEAALVQSGNIDFNTYASSNPTQAQQLVETGFTPPKSGGDVSELSESERKFAMGLSAAKKALSDLESKKVSTGPISTRVQQTGEFFGRTSPGTDFRANLALAQTGLKSGFLGAQQTGGELEGLIDALSDPNAQEDVIAKRLRTIVSMVESQISPAAVDSANKAVMDQEKTLGNVIEETGGSKNMSEFVRNAGQDTKDIINGLLNLPATYIQAKTSPGGTNELVGNMARGAVTDINETLGRPLEGGDILGRMGEHAYEQPVSTALNVLPGIGALKGLKGAKAVDVASDVSKAGKTLPPISRTAKTGTIMQNIAESAGEALSGGGTKELISKNVMLDEARSLSKTLLDKKILDSFTEKGRIEATRKALVDEGRNIDKALKSSTHRVPTGEFADGLRNYLVDLYGESQALAVEEIVNQLSKEGKFNLKSGTQSLDMSTLNKAKTGLYDYGLRQLGIGESGKIYNQMAKDASSYIRKYIEKKVPEATPALREYGNLRTYMDDVLKDPTGANIKAGIWNTVAGIIKRPLEVGVQKLYDQGGNLIPENVSAPAGVQAVAEDIPVSPRSMPPIRPVAAPTDTTVIEQIIRGKGDPQAHRLVRDMRYKQGNWEPTLLSRSKTRKQVDRFIDQSRRKKYK